MAWPPTPIAADKTNADVQENDHPAHHNELAVAINDLVTFGPVATGDSRLTDQRVPTDDSVTNAKVDAAAAIAQSKIANLTADLAALQVIGQHVILNRAASLSVPNNTLTLVPWTSERADAQGWHAANSADVVVPAGRYLVMCQFDWDGWAAVKAGFHHIEVTESGTTRMLAAVAYSPDDSFDNGPTGHMSTFYVAAADATFRVAVYQDSGATRQFGTQNRPLTSAGSSKNTEFSVVRLG